MGELLSKIGLLRKEITSLERCREALATATTDASVNRTLVAFEDARSYTTRQFHELKSQIQREAEATEQLAQGDGTSEGNVDLRARRSGCLMLMHEFRKLDFNKTGDNA
ncbi:hypothetical protein Pmar_PMAR024664 [Perkinsus marinus ATCC 50983]|uniref:Uncharacterized protein n=1 Tax=Perkinsus marinus (strain ATCC 50983 / TXsc) TaxID=423536 RepID=C5M1A3_PERM5|nr:hypothetical protein Pmar_PMAR024664 [Perkinsus marinus ATCC 50983]EEQ97225.1 hypothetical protein Pmar_PMAR024664 [Perkinsus marinus ATCC 50983]|eukprot:XP_002764508.1 hypothetical protein Pmar_PMAR024664 [Perkinsus marinus ATCC 50983]